MVTRAEKTATPRDREAVQIELVRGYGLGVRWRSPVGSLSADVAYGEALREFRLDFTIGFRF